MLHCNGKLMQGDIVVELVGSTPSGETWYFNDTIGYLESSFAVNFTSNGVAYGKMIRISGKFYDQLAYRQSGAGTQTAAYDYRTSTWYNEALRTIVLDEPATGEALAFLEANATKLL